MDQRFKCWAKNHKYPRSKHRKISDVSHSDIFSDISPLARETKENINKWDYIKRKRFCTVKETINKMKRQHTEWQNIFTNTSDNRLISKIYREFMKLNTKKNKTIQFKNGQQT